MNGPAHVVRLAVRGLPSFSRDRYESELMSELAELGWSSRWAHAVEFLLTTPSLRLAVLRAAATHAGFPAPPRHCLLGFGHTYRTVSTEDGSRFRRCGTCGQEDPHLGTGPGDWAAPASIGFMSCQ